MTHFPRATSRIVLLLALLPLVACPDSTPAGPTPVDSLPKVTITEPAQGAVVTVPLIDIRGTVDDDSGITALSYALNGGAERAIPQDIGRTGPFAFAVTLVKGANTITIYADDVADNRGTASVSVTFAIPAPKDAEKPKLTITDPPDGATLDEPTAELIGTATDDIGVLRLTVLAADGVERDVTKKLVSGAFAFPVDLVAGPQTIFVFAYDAAGNRSARQRTLTWDAPKTAVATLVFDDSAPGPPSFGAGATADPDLVDCGAFAETAPELFDLAAQLGLSWLRVPVAPGVEGPTDWFGRYVAGELDWPTARAGLAAWENDDLDPASADPTRVHFTQLADAVETTYLPLKQAIPDLGLVLSVPLMSPTAVPEGAQADEYAELVSETVGWLAVTYAVTPQIIEVVAGAETAPSAVLDAVAAARARLAAADHVAVWWLPAAPTSAEVIAFAAPLQDPVEVSPGLLTHARGPDDDEASTAAVVTAAQRLGTWPGLLAATSVEPAGLIADIGRHGYGAWSLGELASCTPAPVGSWAWVDAGVDALPAAETSPAVLLLGRVTKLLEPGSTRLTLSGEPVGGQVTAAAYRSPAGEESLFVAHGAAGDIAVEGLPAGTWSRQVYGPNNETLSSDSVELAAGETLWLTTTGPALVVAQRASETDGRSEGGGRP
jgi:hypothetical protein